MSSFEGLSLLHNLPYLIPLIHILGVVTALDALYWSRSSQGALAWGISLIAFPYLALPLYWVFGRRRFRGYQELSSRFNLLHQKELFVINEGFKRFISKAPALEKSLEKVLEAVTQNEFTSGNEVKLLIDGDETFGAILAAIRDAKQYILVQFFIIRDDTIGEKLKDCLIEKAAAGLNVYLLYDEVGSKTLSDTYVAALRAGGVNVHTFSTRHGWGNFFQVNFRNHRRIVVIDGAKAFIGGLNVGDEYLGRSKRFGHWRDTHLQLEGPAVIPIQGIFFADWYWATQTNPIVSWDNAPSSGMKHVLPVAFGPSDEKEKCLLFLLETIRSAKQRIWLASPYFVPDDAVIQELRLAALRGVDVRVLLPDKADHWLVWLASFSYVPEICSFGARVFRYANGFHHQKVVLVDDIISAIGTVNLDNRSLRLNFEIMAIVADKEFNQQVEEMLKSDFSQSVEQSVKSFTEFPLSLRLGAKFARLFAPVL